MSAPRISNSEISVIYFPVFIFRDRAGRQLEIRKGRNEGKKKSLARKKGEEAVKNERGKVVEYGFRRLMY